jgi:hypothetical protein
MKQVRFKGKVNGRTVRGYWFCETRPNRAQTVAERLVGNKITNFMFVIKDIKTTAIKCE